MRLALAIIAAVLLSGCEPPKPQPDGSLKPMKTAVLSTVEHEGHWYVMRGVGINEGHFLHSPACPCQRRRLAEDQQ